MRRRPALVARGRPARGGTRSSPELCAMLSFGAALLAANAAASSFPETGTAAFARLAPGARAPALGGGIAAVDAESSAVQSNPAGLAALQSPATVALDAGWPGGGAFLFYAGAAGWATPEFAVGATVEYLDQGPIEIRAANTPDTFTQGQASASCLTIAGAGRILPPVDLGVSFRYMSSNITNSESAKAILSGSGISGDAGVTYRPWPRIALAAVALDVLPAGIDWNTNGRGDVFKRTYRLGGAVDLNPVLVVVQADDAAGPDRRFRGGAEWDVHPRFTLRAGLDGLRPSFGFGARAAYGRTMDLRFDYAFAVTPLGGSDFQHRLTLTVNWKIWQWPMGQLVFPAEEPQPRGQDVSPHRPAPLFTWPDL